MARGGGRCAQGSGGCASSARTATWAAGAPARPGSGGVVREATGTAWGRGRGGAGAPRHGRGKGRAGSPGGGRVAFQADACKGRGPRWSPGCGPGFSQERVSAKTHLSERVNLLKFKGFIALQLSRLAQFSISWWVCGY